MSSIIAGGTLRNGKNLENQLIQAFEAWASEDINDSYWDDQFRDMELWVYDGETVRKNGETVTSPRDIYDTGALYESGIESFQSSRRPNGAEASWNWDATNSSGRAYAYYVHEGAGTNATPRPWTDEIAIPRKFDNSSIKKALLRRIKASLGN